MSHPNPLRVHSILLLLVAAVIVGVGALNLIQATGMKAPEASSRSAQGAISDIQRGQSDARGAAADVDRLASAPTSLSGLSAQIQALTRLMGQLKRYVLPNLLIIWGLLVGAAGYHLLQQANWARAGGFVGVAGTLLYLTIAGVAAPLSRLEPALGADGAAIPQLVPFEAWRPILLIVIAGIAARVLWDLAVERFAPAPAPAA